MQTVKIKYIVIMQSENSNINLPKIVNCIMQTENSNRTCLKQKITLCKMKTVTETCDKI